MAKGDANTLLEMHMKELGVGLIPEHQFAPPRRWRFDYAVAPLCARIAIEIEGAIWTRGRHTRGSGYERDLEKYRMATALGWRVYRFSTGEVLKGVALEFFKTVYTGASQ